jgi:uncharacterized membrane protein YidH (DUF202 family)
MILIYYIYNRIYKILGFFNEDKGKFGVPFTTYLFISFFSGFLVIDIILMSNKSLSQFIFRNDLIYWLIFIPLFVLFYFVTLYKNKYVKIIDRFKEESKFSIWFGSAMILIVSIAIILVFILT